MALRQRDADLDVLLISPPVASVVRPNLGVSALKAALTRRRVGSAVWYLNMDFAQRIGVVLNEWLAISSPVNLLLGEWVFSGLIRGAHQGDDLAYAREVEGRLPAGSLGHAAALEQARSLAEPFVEAVAEQVVAASPSIVGISTTFQQTCAALAIARRVKELAPGITICLGGANCDEPMGSALAARFPQIDVVFAGESDGTFPDFVEQHVSQRGSLRVPRPASGRLHVLAPSSASNVVVGEPITALDELPIPDMDEFFADLDLQPFRERVRPAVVFESSRGCWWGAKHHCTFCGLNANGMEFRAKSAGRVLDEIDYLASRHRIDLFEAADNILNPKFIAGVLDKLVTREPRVSMFFEVKSNMTHDQLYRAARAGVTYVQPGVESLSDTILKLMEKGVTAAQNLAFLRSCREIGIVPCWNMLYRFPGETVECYEEMRRLIPMIEHLDAPMTVSSVRLDRFSPYFERSGEYGYRNVVPFDSYARVFGVDARSAAAIAYFFTGDCPDIVPRDQMQLFFADVSRWKAKHQDPAAAPLLNMIESDGESMVIDTRETAAHGVTTLDKFETQALKEFRRPVRVDLICARLAAERPDAAEVVDRLIARGFIVTIGDVGVSIVCESGWRVHSELRPPFPCGELVSETKTVDSPPLVAAGEP